MLQKSGMEIIENILLLNNIFSNFTESLFFYIQEKIIINWFFRYHWEINYLEILNLIYSRTKHILWVILHENLSKLNNK